MLRSFFVGIAASSLLVWCAVCSADEIIVEPFGGGQFADIQSAIDAAADGDTVLLLPGEYVLKAPISFRGKAITLKSQNGAPETTLRMAELGAERDDRASVVIFENGEGADSVLDGFTITGGRGLERAPVGQVGGGVYFGDGVSPTLKNCRIVRNHARGRLVPPLESVGVGGGVYVSRDASPQLINCTISGNGFDGIACEDDAEPVLRGCTISGNTLVGVYSQDNGSPTLNHCTVSGHFEQGLRGGTPVLTDSIVWDNGGGSIHADARVTFSCVEGDVPWPGVGNINDAPLFCGGWESAEIEVDEYGFESALTCKVDFSLADDSPCLGAASDGGNTGAADRGVCEAPGQRERLIRLKPGTYSMSGLTLFHRVSLAGAGEDATVIEGFVRGLRTGAVLSDLTVTRGGIRVDGDQSPKILRSTITRNVNAVRCSKAASPTLVDCSIVCNLFAVTGGSPILTGCAIWGNTGAGVSRSAATLTNCTIAGNRDGGVVAGSVSLTNCTISKNGFSGVSGGGAASFTLTNCIVWGNSGEAIRLRGGATASVAYSSVDGDIAPPGEGNFFARPRFEREGLFDFDRFDELEIDGTPIEFPDYVVEGPDFRLQKSSLCIDAGTSDGAPDTDMAGDGRWCGAGVDLGAYEMGGCLGRRFLRGECNGDGKVDISDAVCALEHLFEGDDARGCLAALNANGDASVNVSDAVTVLSFLFASGPSPEQPYPACGVSTLGVDGELGCETGPEDCQ